jgi:hypothetical protein
LRRQRLRVGQGLGFRKGLAENNLETAGHRGFRGGTGRGGKQDQQGQYDSMAGNRQSKGQPDPGHREPAAGHRKKQARISQSARLCSGDRLARHTSGHVANFYLPEYLQSARRLESVMPATRP